MSVLGPWRIATVFDVQKMHITHITHAQITHTHKDTQREGGSEIAPSRESEALIASAYGNQKQFSLIN